VIGQGFGQAVHVLDQLHVTQQFGKAWDEIRAAEARRLKGVALSRCRSGRGAASWSGRRT
jgi:hypothetical protein